MSNQSQDHQKSLRVAYVSCLKEIKDEGRRVTLCHYPLMTWPGSRHGAMQLFGHVHNNWVGCRGSVNVGVDLWDFMPVTLDEAQARSQTLPRNLYWDKLEPRAD